MDGKSFRSFAEFWPHYVREHAHPLSRALHVSGTLLALLLLGYLVAGREWRWLWLPPFVGYGFAWVGHMVFERNRPATFRHPLYSLLGDFVLVFKTLSGQMPREVRRYLPAGDQPSQLDS